jgi:serine/threonine-protein kinase
VTTAPPPPPADPVGAIRQSLRDLTMTGDLDTRGAEELGRKVDEYVRAMTRRDLAEAAKKVRELRDRLANLFKDQKVSVEGHDRLSRDIDALAAAVNV